MKVTVEQVVNAIVKKVLSQDERIAASVMDLAKKVCKEKFGFENVEFNVEPSESGFGDVFFDIYEGLSMKSKDKNNEFSMRAVPSHEKRMGMPYVFDFYFKRRSGNIAVINREQSLKEESTALKIPKPCTNQVEQYLRSWDPIMLGIRGDANWVDEMEGMNAMLDD